MSTAHHHAHHVSAGYRPLHDHVLLKAIPKEKVSAGGIIIPDNAHGQQRGNVYDVVAVGSGRTLSTGKQLAVAVKPGERVVVHRYTGNTVHVDGVEHIVVLEDEIAAVIEGEPS